MEPRPDTLLIYKGLLNPAKQ